MKNGETTIWMGIGISKNYVDLTAKIAELMAHLEFKRFIILIADEMVRKYNGKPDTRKIRAIYDNLTKPLFPPGKLEIYPVTKFYVEDLFQQEFQKIKTKYFSEEEFRKDINQLVVINRGEKVEILRASGYILEELAFMKLFHKPGYKKIGSKKSEEPFDLLAQRHLSLPADYFTYFNENDKE